MTYNLTNLTNSETFLDYSIAANQITGGMLFGIFVVLIALVVYSRVEGTESQKLLVSTFFAWIMSVVLNAVGILDSFYVVLFLLFTLGAIIPNLLSRYG